MEVKPDDVKALGLPARVIGTVNDKEQFTYGSVKVTMDEALKAWTTPLKKVFSTDSGVEARFEGHAKDYMEAKKAGTPESELKYRYNPELTGYEGGVYQAKNIIVAKNKVAKPKVFIPVFPGTNCELDSARAFDRAGAVTDVRVFRNLSAEDIRSSAVSYAEAINQSQIIMFPGGFSAGDEPDGSAKFFAAAFRNERIQEAVHRLLDERDGLILGICNGFQALIKLGLVPEGRIAPQGDGSPTLTFNTLHRHISHMVSTKVMSTKSPWLAGAKSGGVYVSPASHGEGRFVAGREWIDRLFANGQVATVYCDPDGNVSGDPEWNINGSYACIEGITSPDGRVFGKMAHIERRGRGVAINITGEQDMKVFESGVKYFS
jgi:phosphoribosylformylglycinamidine synthase